MALSDYERKMLEELEAQLSDEDPSFVENLKPQVEPRAYAHQMSIRHVALGALAMLAGVAILVAGVHFSLIFVGVLGVVGMFFGAWYISSGHTAVPVDAAPKARKQEGPARMREFMEKQAREWERRQRGE